MVTGSVVVTGGSRGIGRAFVLDAASRGYDVFFTHRGRGTDADDTVAAAREVAPEATVTALKVDLADHEALEAAAQSILKSGPVHILVNNAASFDLGSVSELTDEGWRSSLNTNVTVPMKLARAFEDSLRQTKGAILNVSSTGGVVGSVHGAAYGASKAAIIGLAKSLAREFAPDVRVNSIAPGPIRTDTYAELPDDEREMVERETPLGRLGEPWEMARAGLDLSHWEFATGVTLVADGGRVMR